MVLSLLGKMISCVRLVQLLNASEPILNRFLENLIPVNELQLLKALLLIVVTPSGSSNVPDKVVHPLNACDSL